MEHDPILCEFRHEHSNPCAECVESFKIFADLFALHDEVKISLLEKEVFDKNPIIQDDMDGWEEDIHQFLRNILDYRRHIAQTEDEAKFDASFYSNLKSHEAIIIMDFKMKILASLYRERQKDWFSKRGFSCLSV